MRRKNVLILLGMNDSLERLNSIIDFAKHAQWNITLEDRYDPPRSIDCDGILATLLNQPTLVGFARKALARGIPVVDLHDEIGSRRLFRVSADLAAAGRMAARHLAERGFGTAAWFSTDDYVMHDKVREGFRAEWGEAPFFDWTPAADNRRQPVEHWMAKTLRTARTPLGVVTFNTYNAFRLLNACRTAGISVPDEMAIISASNETPYLNEVDGTSISFVDFDFRELGLRAAMTLDALLSGRHTDRITLLPPRGIAVGRSTNTYTSDDPRVRTALLFMRDNIGRPFSATDVAEHLGIPRITLDRLFVNKFGHPTGKEILRLRMAEVKRLLASGDRKLSAIAVETGFCHASYLIKAFSRQFGLTPDEFRRSNKLQVKA